MQPTLTYVTIPSCSPQVVYAPVETPTSHHVLLRVWVVSSPPQGAYLGSPRGPTMKWKPRREPPALPDRNPSPRRFVTNDSSVNLPSGFFRSVTANVESGL